MGFTASRLAPNPTLFSLGVVLLELGYDARLQSLRNESDLKGSGGVSNHLTDFFTAQRLGRVVSKKLNKTYGRLVQRCLCCGFGVGSDLSSRELQGQVMKGVVRELEKCEEVQRKFVKLCEDPSWS
jgi:hypothetical protein